MSFEQILTKMKLQNPSSKVDRDQSTQTEFNQSKILDDLKPCCKNVSYCMHTSKNKFIIILTAR